MIAPNIVTLAAVLDAIPLEDGDPLAAKLPLIFDAVVKFKGFSAMQAPSSPTTLSSCAALALLTLLVDAGSLYRGGKRT